MYNMGGILSSCHQTYLTSILYDIDLLYPCRLVNKMDDVLRLARPIVKTCWLYNCSVPTPYADDDNYHKPGLASYHCHATHKHLPSYSVYLLHVIL